MLRNKKGFTLIELVVAMVVLSVVMGLIVGLVTNSMGFFRDERTQVNNQASLRLIALDFEKDVRKYVLGVDQFSIVNGCYRISIQKLLMK
jgi:prepilin-type N-terminal cleavage/methylation domain-containing protein